ncbi:MAG TPA: glycosyltransferase family 39 protein [Lysobacter sp.]|nr:glycosyltransferase family 39 protein [Lysobacter sp.]
MLKTRASRESWLFWIVAVLVIGAGLGLRDPWPADEPRFALVAKQMVESGEWLFPHRGTELYSDKPPLFMWTQAVAYMLFGHWRVAFLLPSLLAALGTLWCVVDLGRRLWTRRVGLYAGWALLLTLHFTYQAKKAQIDPSVVFWITFANYALLRHLLQGPRWGWWWLGWFAAGIGTITKGVGALALLMIVPAVAASIARWPRVRLHARDWRFWVAPLAFVAAVSLWLLPMVTTALAQSDPAYRAYMDDILFRQTAGRYAKSWDHHNPPWYHLGVMLTMWLPPMLALPWALPAWWRRLKRRDGRFLLPIAWWTLIVVFFSIPDGKRDVYILPALPMACLALAPLLPGLVRRRAVRALLVAFVAALALAALAVGAAVLAGHADLQAKLIGQRGLSIGELRALGAFLLAIAAWMGGALLWFGVRRAPQAAAWALAGLWVLFGLVGYPLLNRSTSAADVMTRAGRLIGPHAELGLVAWKEQNLLMADRPATTFGFVRPWTEQLQRAMRWQAQAPQRRWLLVQEAALSQCVDRSRAVLAGTSNRRRWWLVPAHAADPDCVPQGVNTQNEADRQDDD